MRKIVGLPPVRTQRRYKGAFQTMEYADGRIAARAPQPKGLRVKSAVQKSQNEAFAWCCKASIHAIDYDRIAAEAGSIGTPWLPRDILVSAMYGTLIEIRTKSGQRIVGARTVAADIQALLDQISDQLGAILVRGADEWIGVGTGAPMQVLTANGPGFIPSWQNAAAGGGGIPPFNAAPTFNPEVDSAGAGSNIYIARFYSPEETFDLNGVATWINSTNASNIQAGIYETDKHGKLPGSTLLAQGTAIAPVTGELLKAPFAAPVTLAKGHFYWIGFAITGGSIWYTAQMPVTPASYFGQSTLSLPTNPSTSTANNASNFCCWGY